MSKTYITLNKNNRTTVQLNLWRKNTGQEFSPSGAYYSIKGALKDNTLIPRTIAQVSSNSIWATITTTITASAAEYDLYWEIRGNDGDITYHCTKITVIDNY